jgi:hypothetical protein
MSIEEIKSIIEDKSIALGAEKLRNPDARYMWVVSMSVFDKVRSYCELDKATMDKFFYNVEYHVNHKWHGDNIKLWKEL